MEKYNKELVDQQFNKGKALLDSGHYQESINIYDKLIPYVQQFIPDEEGADVTVHTALNNRGAAKCKLAKKTKDRSLYENGIEDFKNAIENYDDSKDRRMLTAYSNLKYAEKEIDSLDSDIDDDKFHTFFD